MSIIDATSNDKMGPKKAVVGEECGSSEVGESPASKIVATTTNKSTSGYSRYKQAKTKSSVTGTAVRESSTEELTQHTITLTQVSDAIASIEQGPAEVPNGSSSESADAGWTVVRSVRRRARDDPDRLNKTVKGGRGNPIRGSSEHQSVLKGAPRVTSLHLTRLDPGTKAEDVQKFSSQICQIIQCVQLTSKFPEAYSSFKLTVAYEDVDMLLNPDLWPKGTLIQKFFHRRQPKQKAE